MPLAVFDCDGTLIDGQASIGAAMGEAFAACELSAPDPAAVRRTVGLSLPRAMAALAPTAAAALHGRLVAEYTRALRAARDAGTLAQPLFPGIVEMLRALRDHGWALAVATGMSRRGLVHCLSANGLEGWFTSLQTADRHPSKPHPAMLAAALSASSAGPADAVMIGDTSFDMAMARSAGVRAVGVDWGNHSASELRAAGAEFVASGPGALLAYLLT